MALSKITYDTKVALDPQPSVANINKVSDSDMNEIKSVVNDAIDQVNSMIENGSNANGSYVKYDDGTMICYGEESGTTTWSDYWSLCKRSPNTSNDALVLTFPKEFISAPIVQLTGNHEGFIFSANLFSVSTTTLKVMLFKPTNASGTEYKYSWLAIGKWK